MNLELPLHFDTERVEQALREILPNLGVLWVPESGSTNRDLMKMAETGAPNWTVLVSGRQTEGRGRRSRRWVSPEGGLYTSVLVNLRASQSPITLVPLAVGLALSEALVLEARKHGSTIHIWLKWPNDLLTDRGKLAGILCETAFQKDTWLVVAGVGLNVEPVRDRSGDLPTSNQPTSLREEADAPWEHEDILIAFLERLAKRLEDWEKDPDIIRSAWTATSGLIGKQIRVRAGADPIVGIAEGISDIGALRIRTEEGLVEINAAEGIEVHE